MNIFNKNSITEKFLYLFISVLSIIFLLNFVSTNSFNTPIFADESSGSNEGSSNGDEKSSSDNNGDESTKEESASGDEETSSQSLDEVSTSAMEKSTQSVEVSTSAMEKSTGSVDEVSTKSSDSSPEDEVSTPSVVSVKSEVSVEEMSVRSGIDLDNFLDGEIFPVADDAAIVLEDEKLFFVIPIKIEKEVTFDEGGMVLDVQQSLWMRILSWFSF